MRRIFFAFVGFVFFLMLGGVIDGILNPNWQTHMNPLEWPLIILVAIVGGYIGWRSTSKIESEEQKIGRKIMGLNVWLYGLLSFIILGIIEYFFGYIAMIVVFWGLFYFWYHKSKQNSKL